MPLTFEKFNPETDTSEYLKLLDDNLRIIRGKYVQFFLKYRDRRQLRKHLKTSVLITIKVDGVLAGFISYTFTEPSTSYIEHFHLKPQFRRQGFGTRALEFVETKAKEAGCTRLQLAVYASNPALRLYERFGFKRVGFFHGTCWWIYVMRKGI